MSALYAASVPVFDHYLRQAEALVRAHQGAPGLLEGRLAPDMFTGAEQFMTAAGFALRGSYPLAGRDLPEFPQGGHGLDALLERFAFAKTALGALRPEEFDGAETRRIEHRAGFAELDQSGADYLHHFALPNFFFHLSMGFAVLRAGGAEIGKADFDGQHDYPPGFRF